MQVMQKYEKAMKHRVKRIEGQVRGVLAMMERGEPFEKVETQLSAIQSAILAVRKEQLKQHLREGVEQEKDVQTLIEQLFRYLA